jgi:hypothetical protein
VARRLFNAAAGLSLALAIAVAILWHAQIITKQPASVRSGNAVYLLYLTQDGLKIIWVLFNGVSGRLENADVLLEHYYSAVVLFLILPFVWLFARLKWRPDLRYIERAVISAFWVEDLPARPSHMANVATTSADLRDRRWAIAAFGVGVFGLPAYITMLAACQWIFSPIGIIAILPSMALGFGVPWSCAAFVYRNQLYWQGDWIGRVGTVLTITWVTLVFELLIHSILYA